MDVAGVREALHRQPFEPFSIALADGRKLPVKHPDFVAVGNRRIVFIGEDDSTAIIEPLLIVSLDSLPSKPKGANGTHKKKPKG